jgi:inactivated superfamily I helicase
MQKKHFLIAILLFCTSLGFAQNKLFDKYADMDNVTLVYISKAMFQMIPKIDNIEGINFTNLKDKIESLQIITTEKQDLIIQMKKDFYQLVENQKSTVKYQELMRMKDGEDHIRFYSNTQGEQIKELLMLVESDDSFTAILLVGNFSLKNIQDIINQN